MVILLMGVTGAGKTTVGRLLAAELNWPFYDGDDFHPPANLARMARGEPLADEDRWPWLERLRDLIAGLLARDESAVVACSALKSSYRRALGVDDCSVRLVYLQGDYALIRSRLAQRRGCLLYTSPSPRDS